MAGSRPITDFKALTFDCFGTLVDWETGIFDGLEPLRRQLPADHPYQDRLTLLKGFTQLEGTVQRSRPNDLYHAVLSASYGDLANELGLQTSEEDKTRFGMGVGEWPVYPDTIDALQRLQKHFKLVILSNVDKDSFSRTLAKQFPGFTFDAIYTAEEIGSYKPDLKNFQYLIDHCDSDLGVKKDGIIHTAYALKHDLTPAKDIGLTNCWIERGENYESAIGGKLEDFRETVNFSWRFKNMKAMADYVDQL